MLGILDAGNDTGVLIAKGLMALVFLANAFGIVDQHRPVEEMIEAGIPASIAPLMAWGGRGLQLVASVMLFTPYDRWAALGLAGFLVPATLIAHSFWRTAEANRMPQTVNFLKNVCMVGGLIALAFR